MAARLALGLAAVLLTLLALEAGLRLVHPVPRIVNTPDFYAPDPHATYVLKPRAVKTVTLREFSYRFEVNSRGFRGPEFAADPAPSTSRVLLLGDSFTFGWGVDDDATYGRVLERALNRDASAGRFEVINGGVPAYNTLHELRFFESHGVAIKPRYVVLQLLVNDDVRDNLLAGLTERVVLDHTLVTAPWVEKARARVPAGRAVTAGDVQAAVEAETQHPLYERLKAPLARHSHLYRFVVERVPTDRVEQVKRLLRGIGLFIQQDDTQMLSRPQIEVFEAPRSEQIGRAVAVTQQYLRELKGVADAAGATLALVVFPTIFEVDPASRGRLLSRLGLRPEQIDVDGVKNELLAFARGMGIPALELHPIVRDRYTELQPYFPLDGHFNERGYRLAGEAVAAFLREEVVQ